jgi:two-component system sensor kinase FixL
MSSVPKTIVLVGAEPDDGDAARAALADGGIAATVVELDPRLPDTALAELSRRPADIIIDLSADPDQSARIHRMLAWWPDAAVLTHAGDRARTFTRVAGAPLAPMHILGHYIGERIQLRRVRDRLENTWHQDALRYRALAESNSDWIWEVDTHDRYTYVSPRVRDILGYEPADLLGKTPFDFMPADEAPRVYAVYAEAVAAQRPFAHLENINVHRDGSLRVLESGGVPITDADGSLCGYRGIDRDVTDRRRAEDELQRHRDQLEELVARRTGELQRLNRSLQQEVHERRQAQAARRKSESRFQKVVEALPVCITYVDADERYRLNNRTYGRWFGIPPAQIHGKTVREVVGEKTYAEIRHHIREVLSGRQVSFDSVIHHADREPRPVGATYIPDIDDSGRVLGYFAIITDLSERNTAEALREKHLLELAHMARLTNMGGLATEIAHELNQPLTAVANYGHACLALLAAGHQDIDRLREILRKIVRQAEWAGELIHRMRDFLRKQDPEYQPVNINQLIGDVLVLLEAEARGHDIDIQLQLEPALPEIMGDRVLLGQVIVNLARNAIDALRQQPSGPRRLTITTASDGSPAVRVAVRDSGPGMSENTLERLFQPFFTTKTEGLGMGLAISRSLVEAHGGKLQAVSRPGQETTMTFTIPARNNDNEQR